MNFNDFCKNNKVENNSYFADDSKLKDEKNSQMNNKEEIENMYEKYKNFNNEQLMEELLNQTAKKKKDGSLNNEKLNDIKAKLSPFLNSNQNESLNKIIERLK